MHFLQEKNICITIFKGEKVLCKNLAFRSGSERPCFTGIITGVIGKKVVKRMQI
jgi:hypothetical protein